MKSDMTPPSDPERVHFEWECPEPPAPPTTFEGLFGEMLGAVRNNPGVLCQGALRYWLMWRLPQILGGVSSAPGLKLHFCSASARNLRRHFPKLAILADVLTIGQCDRLLVPTRVSHQHNFDRPWPEVTGNQGSNGAWVLAGTVARPFHPWVFDFLESAVGPFAKHCRVVFAPFASMLAPATPCAGLDVLSEYAELVSEALSYAKPKGLPFRPWVFPVDDPEGMADHVRKHRDGGGSTMMVAFSSKRTADALNPELKVENGLLGDLLPDEAWDAKSIIGFELCMAHLMGSSMLVGGQWCDTIPESGFEFSVRLPYIEGLTPLEVARAVNADPGAMADFRRAVRAGLHAAVQARGAESYSREIHRIQDEIINAGIEDLERKWRSIVKMRWLRGSAAAVSSLALTVGIYFGTGPGGLAALLGTTAASAFLDLARRVAETGELRGEPMYFLWKLRR